jgi:hypothetical protein
MSVNPSGLPWLHGERAKVWLRILATISLVAVVAWIALSRGGLDIAGKPLGTDFISFWSASRLVLDGAPATAVYDPPRHAAVQTAAFDGADVGYSPFPYPPSFLLICLPLGLLPYFPSLIAWVGLTGLAYWRVASAWLGPRQALPALAFPAVIINLGHGQNAFLTTALFGTGALLLGRRDVLAGICLGALAFKPHLGLLIPIVLVASRNWRAFAGAAASAVGLTLASAAVFGLDAWRAFPDQLVTMRAVVEQGLLSAGKIQTVFAALRNWGAPLELAYGAQAVTAAVVAVAAAAFAWRHPRSTALGPALIAATLLVSPYLLDYDLLLAAIPLAWLYAEARAGGFRPWEKAVMLAAYVLPLIARLLATQVQVTIAPLVLAALLTIILRRGWTLRSGRQPEMAAA